MNPSMQECIDTCVNCHRVCLETFTQHCLKMGGAHVEQQHARLMLDCIQICQTCADFMLRGSELHQITCNACAEICQLCAEDCARFEGDEMRRCAETCSHCAQVCHEMAGTSARELAFA